MVVKEGEGDLPSFAYRLLINMVGVCHMGSRFTRDVIRYGLTYPPYFTRGWLGGGAGEWGSTCLLGIDLRTGHADEGVLRRCEVEMWIEFEFELLGGSSDDGDQVRVQATRKIKQYSDQATRQIVCNITRR